MADWMDCKEDWWNDNEWRKTTHLKKNQSQCHCVRVAQIWFEDGPLNWEASTWLSKQWHTPQKQKEHGTASDFVLWLNSVFAVPQMWQAAGVVNCYWISSAAALGNFCLMLSWVQHKNCIKTRSVSGFVCNGLNIPQMCTLHSSLLHY
jgi:hypothetical protein